MWMKAWSSAAAAAAAVALVHLVSSSHAFQYHPPFRATAAAAAVPQNHHDATNRSSRRWHQLLPLTGRTSYNCGGNGRQSLCAHASSSSTIENGGDADADTGGEEAGDGGAIGDELKSRNSAYINGLMKNLQSALDSWIVSGSLATRRRAYNIMVQIEREAMDDELTDRARRMAQRATMPLDEPPSIFSAEKLDKDASPSSSSSSTTSSTVNVGDSDSAKRKMEANARKEWESARPGGRDKIPAPGPGIAEGVNERVGRSALSNRAASASKPDIFMPEVDRNLDPARFANNMQEFSDYMKEKDSTGALEGGDGGGGGVPTSGSEEASAAQASELVARAGAGTAFEGETLGIGGLDEVLSQVKRRVWVPLAAPPALLQELGINPVRGLLLYGLPGCGKTLLARSLGKILSPARPITVVSGPEIMDKFVGSSEANLREIFDNPPDIYDGFRINTDDNGEALCRAALHVIVLDEFDAVARARGGSDGKGGQGDAGVARDSVVNQLLAKMDGVDPLVVPTLVIGLTNKRTLIEPALLRPGRFEVQIEVPPPKTVAQRISILRVHMNNMFRAGRVLVCDAPDGTAASMRLQRTGLDGAPSYDELLDLLAVECDGMSGASLAAVARAAASRALERAVYDFAGHFTDDDIELEEGGSIADCLVTKADFEKAIEDVFESSRGGDGGDTEPEVEATADDDNDATGDDSEGEIN